MGEGLYCVEDHVGGWLGLYTWCAVLVSISFSCVCSQHILAPGVLILAASCAWLFMAGNLQSTIVLFQETYTRSILPIYGSLIIVPLLDLPGF